MVKKYALWAMIFAYSLIVDLLFLPLFITYELRLEMTVDSILIVIHLLLLSHAFKKFKEEPNHDT